MRITSDLVSEMSRCSLVTPRQISIAEMCLTKRVSVVARQLGISPNTVYQTLYRALGAVKRCSGTNKYQIDDAWFARQVEHVRSLESDPHRQGAYLRGIAYVHGDDMANRVQAEADGRHG